MSTHNALKWLIPPIFLLALVAAAAGLWPGDGASYPLTTFRGEQVTINARGLYYWDTVSTAAQMQANDLVTLALGLPLLAVSFWLARRGSLRGRLLLTGTLGFFLYTYMSMCFGAAYNPLFLVYVALFGLSLYAFILSMMSFDLAALPARFSDRLPRRGSPACSSSPPPFSRWPGLAVSPPPLRPARSLRWKTSPACSFRRWTWR